jgi:4-amino-4-deoxy-L-arabinose transferase-like glycosyltransferase
MTSSPRPSFGVIAMPSTAADSAPACTPSRWGGIPLLAVIGFGLAIRLAFFAATFHASGGLSAAHTTNGTAMYLRPATSLLSTGRLAVDGAPELLHPPGYALVLTAGLWTGHLELVTLALQLLLAAATIWLVYDITLSWTDRRGAALGAAILAAIEPMSIVFSSLLMSETLFTFLLVLTVHRLLCYINSESLAALLQTALLLAMATLVRPVSYYLPTILAALLVAHGLWRSEGRLRGVCHAAIFWAVSMAPLGAWQLRNYDQTGYSGFAAIADFNLYFFHGASVLAHQRGQSMDTVQNEMGLSSLDRFYRLHPELRFGNQAAKFHFMHAEGVRLIREDPWTFAKAYLRGVAVLVLNPGASEVLDALHCYPKDRPARPANLGLLGIARQMQATAPRLFYCNLLLLAGLAAAYLTAALGLASQLRRLSWPLVALATIALYLLAVSGGAQCVTRLRHPVMPLVFVLSGIGIAQLAAWWHRLRAGRPASDAIAPAIARRAAA